MFAKKNKEILSTAPALLQKRQRKSKKTYLFQRNEHMRKYKKGKEFQKNFKDISQVSLTKIQMFCKKDKEMLYDAGFSKKSRAEPIRAEPSRAEPSRAEPSRAKPSRAEPSRAEPSRAEPNRTVRPTDRPSDRPPIRQPTGLIP